MPAQLRIARTKERRTEFADSIRVALEQLQSAREAREVAETRYRMAEQAVLTLLTSVGQKSTIVATDEGRYRVTISQSERLVVNEAQLRKAISAPVYDRLCDLKLNRLKLEEAIAEGRVDPVVVASHTEKVTNKPSARVTLIQGSEG
jgi:hypothetical protein